jgi:putative flippase GtrA
MSAAALRFAKFSCIGIAGFLVDAGVFQALVSFAGVSPYIAKILSFPVAATVSWWLNRTYTYASSGRVGAGSQWAQSLAVNVVGGLANYAVFAAVYAAVPLATAYPVMAVAAGAVAGLVFNFTLSDKLVFRSRSSG